MEILHALGSFFSIISFIPIASAVFIWFRKRQLVTIELKDKEGKTLFNDNGEPLRFKVQRKYITNADLTPIISNKFFDGARLSDEVRNSILELTLTKGFEKIK